jgi:hypothetical protein
MTSRFDAFRPYALLITAPPTLLWAPALGAAAGSVMVALHACGVLLASAWWTRRDLQRGFDPRLALRRDRFLIDRETLEVATPLLVALFLVLLVALLILDLSAGLYALLVALVALWNINLPVRRRYVLIEILIPALLLIAPAMLLRAPAWDAEPSLQHAITPAAHAATWLAAAGLLACILAALIRDQVADRRAGAVTIATKITRETAISVLAVWTAAITLLAGIGVGWWGAAPIVAAGWTAAATLVLFVTRWDAWAVGAAIIGYAVTTIAACLAVAA